MSTDEIYIAQGKARDELKRLRSSVATIKADIQLAAQLLKASGELAERLAADSSNNQTDIEGIKLNLRQINIGTIIGRLEELNSATHKMRCLQEKVDQF